MGKQSQRQASQHQRQDEERSRKRPGLTDLKPSRSRSDTSANEEDVTAPIDDGRTIHGHNPHPAPPERDVEGRGHSTEDMFDADNRGQR